MNHDDGQSSGDGDNTVSDEQAQPDDGAAAETEEVQTDSEAAETVEAEISDDTTAESETTETAETAELATEDESPDAEESADSEGADSATVAVDAADDSPAEPVVESVRHPLASLALAVSVAALVAAVVCLGYFGYTGIRAYTVDSSVTQLRTESVDAAEQAVLNITEVDLKDPQAWRKRIEGSLTGDALKQVKTDVVEQVEQQVKQAGGKLGKLDSRITRSGVTELNRDDDTATVLVYAATRPLGTERDATETPMGFLLTMVDVDGVRKAEKIIALQTIEYTGGTQVDPNQTNPTQTDPNQQQGGGN